MKINTFLFLRISIFLFGISLNSICYSQTDCIPDIRCHFNEWGVESNAIVQINSSGNPGTGVLINNEQRNGRPLLLTALHVIDLNNDKFISTSERNAVFSNTFFTFRFRTSTCNGAFENDYNILGATLLAYDAYTDIALLELREQPAFDATFLGWNNSAGAPPSGVCIQNPRSVRQRIAFSSGTITTSADNKYFCVNWGTGKTAKHASGAPLLTNNHLVTGILSLGACDGCDDRSASCLANSRDNFSKLAESWYILRSYLSPSQGLQTFTHLIPSRINGLEQICAGTTTTYSIELPASMSATWTVSGNLTILSQNRSSVTVTPASASSSGTGTITASVTQVISFNTVTTTSTKTIQVNLPVSNQGVTIRNTTNNTSWSSNGSGNLTMCYGQPNYLQVSYAHGNGATNAEWTFPSAWSYSSQYGTSVGVTPYSTGYGNLTVKIANSCGWALYPVGFGVNVNHCYSGILRRK
jgi:hypothetical protein